MLFYRVFFNWGSKNRGQVTVNVLQGNMGQNKLGQSEMLLHCSKCNQSSHPTCVGRNISYHPVNNLHLPVRYQYQYPTYLPTFTQQNGTTLFYILSFW